MNQKQVRFAKATLQRAFSLLATRARSELGTAYEAMADLHAQIGDVDQARDFYTEARRRLSDLNAYKAELKKGFVTVQFDHLGSRKRIRTLERLREEFAGIKSYREAMVQIELARSYYFLKSPEALIMATTAYCLLANAVKMPSKAAMAKRLLQRIRRGQPLADGS